MELAPATNASNHNSMDKTAKMAVLFCLKTRTHKGRPHRDDTGPYSKVSGGEEILAGTQGIDHDIKVCQVMADAIYLCGDKKCYSVHPSCYARMDCAKDGHV